MSPPTASAVITGATSGLGLACAESIARTPGWRVVLAVRDSARGAAAASVLSARTGNECIDVVALDLASLASVRGAARRVATLTGVDTPVRALVANAGLQVPTCEYASADGYELTFAVNHLGHFLLTRLLEETMAPGARVVVVSSGIHFGDLRHGLGLPAPQWSDPRGLARPRPGPGRVAYATSKLANLYFTYELARRRPPQQLGVNAFDPGLLPGTGLARDAGAVAQLFWQHVLPRLRPVLPGVSSVRASGAALARLAVGPRFAGISGRYIEGDRDAQSSEESYDGARAEELWRVSEELTGLSAEA